ncbi:hypothetical protein DPMN_102018 [Dreissena polymorpha]|uniref:Uncharacterized protein n=1 Tax=Dreissena polymorpha TaxID=45954 RepID=A0A9D4LJS0_DREPO|nr:hypothetical protein DPMN_102018 [Dreissena polymorpha]
MPTSQHRNTKDLSAGWHFLYKYFKGAIRHVPSPSFEHYINLPTSQHPNTEDLSAGWHFLYKYYNGTIRHVFQPFRSNTTLNHEGPERTITARNRKTSLFRTLCFI